MEASKLVQCIVTDVNLKFVIYTNKKTKRNNITLSNFRKITGGDNYNSQPNSRIKSRRYVRRSIMYEKNCILLAGSGVREIKS